MMCPAPRSLHSERARFQCTTCHPPVPRPSSTAVVLTTTGSPSSTDPVSCVKTYARSGPVPRSTSTRWSPARCSITRVTLPLLKAGMAVLSEGRDQPLDAVVARLERVLAQDRALRLVVQLQVDPVDCVVALSLLGALDERAPEPCPRGLGRG